MRRIAALVLALGGCSADAETVRPLAERGAAIARDPTVTRSSYNIFACTTCHAESPAGSRGRPGAALRGAARRPSFWGGEVLDLREAVTRCWTLFMRGDPADIGGPTGDALEEWLWSLSPEGSADGTGAVPLTWTDVVRDLPGGDPARGRAVYQRACAWCHGEIGTGRGRLNNRISRVPTDTVLYFDNPALIPADTPRSTYFRTLVIEKVRHGSFLGFAGVMPPYAREVLSDAELADIVSALGLPGDR